MLELGRTDTGGKESKPRKVIRSSRITAWKDLLLSHEIDLVWGTFRSYFDFTRMR